LKLFSSLLHFTALCARRTHPILSDQSVFSSSEPFYYLALNCQASSLPLGKAVHSLFPLLLSLLHLVHILVANKFLWK
jgi:hypothetical protein